MLNQLQINKRLELIEYLLQLNFFKGRTLEEKTNDVGGVKVIAQKLDSTLAQACHANADNIDLITVSSESVSITASRIVSSDPTPVITDTAMELIKSTPNVIDYVANPTIIQHCVTTIHKVYASQYMNACQAQYEYLLKLKQFNTAAGITIPDYVVMSREKYLVCQILNTLKQKGSEIFDNINILISQATPFNVNFEQKICLIFTDLMPVLFDACFFSFYFVPIFWSLKYMVEILQEFWSQNENVALGLEYYQNTYGHRDDISRRFQHVQLNSFGSRIWNLFSFSSQDIKSGLIGGFSAVTTIGICLAYLDYKIDHKIETHAATAVAKKTLEVVENMPKIPDPVESATLIAVVVHQIYKNFVNYVQSFFS